MNNLDSVTNNNVTYSKNYIWIQENKARKKNQFKSVFGLNTHKKPKGLSCINKQNSSNLIKNKKNRFALNQALTNLNSLKHDFKSHVRQFDRLVTGTFFVKLPQDLSYLLLAHLKSYVTLSRKLHQIQNYKTLPNTSPLFNNILTKSYKTSYTNNFSQASKGTSESQHPITQIDYKSKLTLLKTFNGYLRVSTNIGNQTFFSHSSLIFNYFYRTKFGISITSLPKLFNKWQESYLLLFNLSFFNIEILAFGSSFFKNEVLAINWKTFNQFQFMWRYTKPLLMFSPNRIFNYGDMVFRKIRLLGLNTAYITDVLYHSKTIYYLHRAGFYTIGPVPSNYNINTVNYAIPTSDDNLITQLFFIRFVISIQRIAKSNQFRQHRQNWSIFHKSLL